jgi:predicted RNA binding protein YcfA (HicA-like mRNA interferase family)
MRLHAHVRKTLSKQRLRAVCSSQLQRAWTLRSVRGSHHVFTHPAKPGHICVPHPKQDLGVGLVHKLMKQAGLK